MTFSVREMVQTDAEAVTELSAQLGYITTTAQLEKRFATLKKDPNNGLFVAVRDAEVVGWLHVYGVRLLETNGYAEIGGVVVDAAVRRQGVGRLLVQQAEVWTAAHGFGGLRLRSGLHRREAHTFYERLGYELTKTSHMFCKKVWVMQSNALQ